MAKITLKQAQELLQSAGVEDVEVVANDQDADKDYSADDMLDAIDKSRLDLLRPQIEAELKPDLETRITGKVSASLRTAIRRVFSEAGLKDADLKDLKEEDILKLVKEKYNGTMNKDTEALREEISEMSTAHEEALRLKDEEIVRIQQEGEKKFIDRDISQDLFGIIDKSPVKGGDKKFLSEGFKKYLEEKYHVVYDAAKGTRLRSLDNKELPALKEGGKVEILPADVANEYLTLVGVLATDTRHINPASTNNSNNNQPGAVKIETNDNPSPNTPTEQVNNAMMEYLSSEVG